MDKGGAKDGDQAGLNHSRFKSGSKTLLAEERSRLEARILQSHEVLQTTGCMDGEKTLICTTRSHAPERDLSQGVLLH